MLEFLRLQPTGQMGRCERERIKNKSYARVKTRTDGTSFPLQVIPSQNKIEVFTNVKNYSHGGTPTNLSFTCTDCFYSKSYCGRPAASADGTIDEDKGSSLSDGMTFGSVRDRTTLTSNLVSTPSAGWMTSS